MCLCYIHICRSIHVHIMQVIFGQRVKFTSMKSREPTRWNTCFHISFSGNNLGTIATVLNVVLTLTFGDLKFKFLQTGLFQTFSVVVTILFQDIVLNVWSLLFQNSISYQDKCVEFFWTQTIQTTVPDYFKQLCSQKLFTFLSIWSNLNKICVHILENTLCQIFKSNKLMFFISYFVFCILGLESYYSS